MKNEMCFGMVILIACLLKSNVKTTKPSVSVRTDFLIKPRCVYDGLKQPSKLNLPRSIQLGPISIKIHFVITGANISLLLGKANEWETPVMMTGWVLKANNILDG